jgi:hypothetical protein
VGLQLPGELVTFLNMVGYTWPQADETALFEMGQRWIAFGGTMQEMVSEAESAAGQVWAANRGADIAAFQQYWQGEDAPAGVLGDGVMATTLVGTGMIICGTIVLALKIQVIVQLVILAIQIAQAVATAVATFGASLAEIPIFQMIAREVIGLLIDQVITLLLDA